MWRWAEVGGSRSRKPTHLLLAWISGSRTGLPCRTRSQPPLGTERLHVIAVRNLLLKRRLPCCYVLIYELQVYPACFYNPYKFCITFSKVSWWLDLGCYKFWRLSVYIMNKKKVPHYVCKILFLYFQDTRTNWARRKSSFYIYRMLWFPVATFEIDDTATLHEIIRLTAWKASARLAFNSVG